MKRIFLVLAVMVMAICVSAQTKKTTTAKKTTTTAVRKSTTAKKSTAKKTTTTKKSTATAKKTTTSTTAAKTTTTTTQTAQPARTVQQHREVSYSAPAKQTNSSISQTKKSSHHAANEGWNEVYNYLGASFIKAKYTEKVNGDTNYENKISGTAFRYTLGYNHAFPLSQAIPLYLRAGGAMNLELGTKNVYDKDEDDRSSHYSSHENKDDYDLTALMFSVNMNVDCGYKIPLANGKLHIMPYLGGDLKLNVAGAASYGNGDSYNIFNKKDMEDTEFEKGLRRVQGGFHIGVDFFAIRHLVVGMQYQYYTPLFKQKDSHYYENYKEDEYVEEEFKITHGSFVVKAGFVW